MTTQTTKTPAVSTGQTLAPTPYLAAARYAAAILQLGAAGDRDSVKLVSIRRSAGSRRGRVVAAVVPTPAGTFIARKAGIELTPQTFAGIVLVSGGKLVLTPDGLGIMTRAALDARKADAAVISDARKAYAATVRGLVSGAGLDEAQIEAIAGGVTFA